MSSFSFQTMDAIKVVSLNCHGFNVGIATYLLKLSTVCDCTILDLVVSTGPDTVCEARAASVFSNHTGSRSTPGISTRSTADRGVLQSSRWRHRLLWRPMPPIRRWHSAPPPSDARRQHSCWPVHSRRLYTLTSTSGTRRTDSTESRQIRSALHEHSHTT